MPAITTNVLNQRTLEDFLEVWINAFLVDRKAQNFSPGTIKFYNVKLGLFADYCEAHAIKQISQLTPVLLREYLLYLEAKGHNPGGIHACYRSVKTFLLWFEQETEIEGWKNPINKVKAPKNPEQVLQGITREEFETLLQNCENDFLGIRDKAILHVLYDTGVRAEELCNINLADMNFIDNSILIRQGKGRKPRFVFFGKTTKKHIKKYLKLRKGNFPSLFVNQSGERLVYIALRQIVRRIADKAKLKGIGLHDFRRAFCLNCLIAGMSEITIARLMGHASTQLIGRYAKQLKEHLLLGYKSPVDGSL